MSTEIVECIEKDLDRMRAGLIELTLGADSASSEESSSQTSWGFDFGMKSAGSRSQRPILRQSSRRSKFLELAALADSVAKAKAVTVMPWARTQKDLCDRLAIESLERQDLLEDVANAIRLSAEGSRHEAKIEIYCELLERQIDVDRKRLLPLLFDRMSEEAKAKLGGDYMAARQLTARSSLRSA